MSEWEFEEPEPVEASHLVRTRCSGCGNGGTLATPERAHSARCTECMGGSVAAPHLAGQYQPVVGYPLGTPLPVEVERELPPRPELLSGAPEVYGVHVPTSALKLAEDGREWGWEVRTAYSRGYGPKKYRGQWQKEELISVRFGAHPATDRQAFAIYRTIAGRDSWTWRSVWLWGPDLPPFGHCGVTDLRYWLSVAGRPAPLWQEHVEAAAVDLERGAKARAAERPAKRATKEGLS